MVSLKVLASPDTKAGEGGTATATLPAKETDIFDLSIFIFNSNGDVIGFTSKDFSDGKPTAVVVKTRKATGCSVYAVANAKTLNKGNSPFDGVSTLSVFKTKYLSFADAKAPNNDKCLLMMGVSSDFDTSSASSASPATITLKRLASRIDYTITVKNDNATTFPIVVDSYQLCNVPTSTFYQQSDFTNPSTVLQILIRFQLQYHLELLQHQRVHIMCMQMEIQIQIQILLKGLISIFMHILKFKVLMEPNILFGSPTSG